MTAPRFSPGDAVSVRADHPPGHVRTPYFIRGREGVVQSILGAFENPEDLAYGRRNGEEKTLYRVTFTQAEVWPRYDGSANDTLVVDIYEHWLEARS